jgi:hypothetical protein
MVTTRKTNPRSWPERTPAAQRRPVGHPRQEIPHRCPEQVHLRQVRQPDVPRAVAHVRSARNWDKPSGDRLQPGPSQPRFGGQLNGENRDEQMSLIDLSEVINLSMRHAQQAQTRLV